VHDAVVASVDEEQPADMSPEEIDPRGMGVGLMIAVLVVHAMDGDPARGGVLEGADTAQGDEVLETFGAFESAVGQESVVTDGDP